MVAGMLMPLERLQAIYELLFREGVMVAKKDKRPQSFHPQLPGVTHLQVTRAMGSLRSRGLVRETFAWRHCYWYLTDEGVGHLRRYLHLPPEIVPASLQRARRPPDTAARRPPDTAARRPPDTAARRPPDTAARAQTVPGLASCPPKRQAGSEEGGGSRQAYRRREETREQHVEAASAGGVSRPAPGPSPAPGRQRSGMASSPDPAPSVAAYFAYKRAVLRGAEGLLSGRSEPERRSDLSRRLCCV
ncbi:unnamed protein product, partial [Eretmochelys imbricata]